MDKAIADTPKTPSQTTIKARRANKALDTQELLNTYSDPAEDLKNTNTDKSSGETKETYNHIDDGLIPADVNIPTPDNRLWWHYYLTPGTEEYSNATMSSIKVWPHLDRATAANKGFRMLQKANSVPIIRYAIERSGANAIRRMQRLARIATGSAVRTIHTEKGIRKEQPTFTEQIHAIKELNKVDGIDAALSVEEKAMTAEMKRLYKDMVKELRAGRESEHHDRAEVIEGSIESIDPDSLTHTELDDEGDDQLDVTATG